MSDEIPEQGGRPAPLDVPTRCPSCNAEIIDEDLGFCFHCGEVLSLDRATATALAREVMGTVDDESRSSTARVIGAAVTSFLAMLAVGSILVVAVKLQDPDFGAGAEVVSVLKTIVLFGLGSLGVGVSFGDVQVVTVPLGAMIITGVAIMTAARASLPSSGLRSAYARAFEGAKPAIPFALLCAGAAMFARFDDPVAPVGADAASALTLGLLWGALFGVMGGLSSQMPLRSALRSAALVLRSRPGALREGLIAGALMSAVAWALALAFGLAWLVASMLLGGAGGSTAGELGASAIHLVAFAPNIVVSILAVGLGAPIEFGARLELETGFVGGLRELSLWDWPGGAPWFAWATLGIPAIACAVGGATAARAKLRSRPAPVLVVAGLVFAFTQLVVAALADATLGAGLVVSQDGFARVGPSAPVVWLFALGWAVVAGGVGWALVARRRSIPDLGPMDQGEPDPSALGPIEPGEEYR